MVPGIQKTTEGWQLGAGIAGVAIDSRRVKPGYVFVAIPGATSDGHAFIADAIGRGAVAVVGENPELDLPVPYFLVESSRAEAAKLSAEFFRHPSHHLKTVGVTGTNGKTSVVYWLTAFLRAAGKPTGMVSSVVNDSGTGALESVLTTPESPDLQGQLRSMVDHGLTHAVVEVSSHGIAQHRVDQLRLDLAVLTNITREHLDFHGTMENYVDTKAQLFERLPEDSLGAVINADDAYSTRVRGRLSCPVITFGLAAGDLVGEIISQTAWSSRVRLKHADFEIAGQLNHPGTYNIYNFLAAAAAAYRLGVEPAVIEAAMPYLPSVPGRMQVMTSPGHPTVVVDYAHTPDGLTQSLKTVRTMVSGSVWLVFGARGGRDRGKRPEMGRIAATLADHIVLTSDSPNDEEPLDIANAIKTGIDEVAPGKLTHVEVRRDDAIRWAIQEASSDDSVLITGRGPEAYQNFHGQRVRLKDAEVVQDTLGVQRSEGVDGIGIH